jgi:DNA repair exonuclease SbcCD nuclease subunit
MKVLAIGDLHYKSTNTAIMPKVEENLLAIVEETQPHKIVLLGDILDRHETVHTDHLNAAIAFIEKLRQRVPTYVLMGNHDLSSNRVYLEPQHAFNALKGRENLEIVDAPLLEGPLLFMPYVPNGMFMKAVGNLHTQAAVVFCHQEFKGASFGHLRSESPDEWPSDASLLISGHIHDRQALQPNLLYAGTPFQQAFGESLDKTVCLVELTPGKYPSFTHLPTNMPKRITLELSIDEIADLDINPNDLYRIQIKCPSPSAWQAFRKTKDYKKLIAMNVKLMPITDKPNADKNTSTTRKSYLQVLQDLVNQDKESALLNTVLQEIASETHA